MRVISFLLGVAALGSAAPSAPKPLATLYTVRNYDGDAFPMYESGKCVDLPTLFSHNIESINLAKGVKCRLYYVPKCVPVDYYNEFTKNETFIDNPVWEAARCYSS
ncbi:hypothetical protein CDD81_204 [Ophiocordyceps australis]|uniref:LysM domain-containing protein n=1 Tax=Ophiocordyceps australis TaxID=1399860 RepID=A0A2C5YGX3_9HYPO|nr:hypothetical protein CDD81_204 [Ophiocordyceps australis]